MSERPPSADRPASELCIEPLERARDADLVELARQSLGQGRVPRSEAFWAWKHRENPFGASLGCIASNGEAVVGMRPFMRWTWCTDKLDYPAVRAVDTATHPDWQRRGIFRTLTEAGLEEARELGVAFVFNTPNDKSLPGYLKMGWQRVGRIPLRVRVFRPFQALVRATGVGDTPPRVPDSRSVPEAYSAIEDPAPELESWRGEPRLHTPRSTEYLRWRYSEAPGLAYRAASAGRGASRAAVIYRLRDRGRLRELMVCEVLLGVGRSAVANGVRLLRRIGRDTDAHYGVAIAGKSTPESAALWRAGFLPVPRAGPVLTIRPVSEAVDRGELSSWARWRLSVGDIELF